MKFNWQKENELKYSNNDKSSTIPRNAELSLHYCLTATLRFLFLLLSQQNEQTPLSIA